MWVLIFTTTIIKIRIKFCFFFISLTSLFTSAIVGDGIIEERGLQGLGNSSRGWRRAILSQPSVKQTCVYMGVSISNFQGFVIYHEKCENSVESKKTQNSLITNHAVSLYTLHCPQPFLIHEHVHVYYK